MKTGLSSLLLLSFCFASGASVSEYNKNFIQEIIQEQKMEWYGIEVYADEALPHIEYIGPNFTKTTFPLTEIQIPVFIACLPARLYINQVAFDALADAEKTQVIKQALVEIQRARKIFFCSVAAIVCCAVLYEVGILRQDQDERI